MKEQLWGPLMAVMEVCHSDHLRQNLLQGISPAAALLHLPQHSPKGHTSPGCPQPTGAQQGH